MSQIATKTTRPRTIVQQKYKNKHKIVEKMTTIDKPLAFKRLQKELQELEKAAPFVQVEQTIVHENGDEITKPMC